MATEINKNNFLGSMFPNVYIKSISLEKDFKVEAKIKNVHHPGEVFHGSGPMATTSLMDERLKITVKSELYEQFSDDGQLVSLGAQGYESYISFTTIVIAPAEKEIENIQASENLIKVLSDDYDRGQFPVGEYKNSGYPFKSMNLYQDIIKPKLLMNPLVGSLFTVVDEAVKADPVAKNYNLKGKQIQAELLTKFIRSMPSFQGHGGKTYVIPFETEITLEVPNHDNLAIVQFAEFDINALAEDFPEFGKTLNFNNIGTVFGLPSFQIIRHKGETVFNKKIFLDPDGVQWHGPRHMAAPEMAEDDALDSSGNPLIPEGSFMTGVGPTVDSVPLSVSLIPADNIHDYTTLSKLENLKIDLDFLDNDFMNPAAPDEGLKGSDKSYNNNTTKDVLDSLGLKLRPVIFSDLYATRTTNGKNAAAAMLFSVDLRSLMIKHSSSPMIYSNDNMLNHSDVMLEVFNKCRLNNLKVYRKRVFDEGENEEHDKQLIIDIPVGQITNFGNGLINTEWHHRPLPNTKYLPRNYERYSGAKENVPRIEKVNIHLKGDSKSHKHMLHFNVYDPTIPNDINSLHPSGARFKYIVEMSIHDGTREYMYTKYADLTNLSKALDRMLKVSENILYYDYKKNKFKKSFYNLLTAPSKDNPTGDWVSMLSNRVQNYISVLNVYASPKVGESLSKIGTSSELKSKIVTILDPATGATRDSVSVFKKMVDDLAGRLSKSLGLEKIRNKSLGAFDSSDPATDKKGDETKRIKIKHEFNNLFDASSARNLGYDYLSVGKVDDPSLEPPWRGLLKLTPSDYFIKRIGTERNKYFNAQAQNLHINYAHQTGYTQEYNLGLVQDNETAYLSPLLVRVDQTNYSLFGNIVLAPGSGTPSLKNLHRDCILDILGLNEGNYKKNRYLYYSKQNQDNKEEIRKQVQLQELISKYNVSINSVDHGDFNSDVDLDMIDDELSKIYEFSTAALGNPKEENSDDYKEIIQTVSGMINEKTNQGSTLMLSIISKKIFNKLPLHRKWKGTSGLEKYDITNKDNILNTLSNTEVNLPPYGEDFIDWAKTMPNQIKALFVSGDPGNSSAKYNFFQLTAGAGNDTIGDVNDLGKFYLHFQKLVKVEYLSSYGNVLSGKSLKNAQWRTLTGDVTMKGTNKMLLCRLVPYNDPSIVECEIPELDLPMYNQYFLIDPSKT